MGIMTTYEHGQFSWVDLVAHDMNSAREFYGSLFGWKSVLLDTQGGPPYVQFELEGNGVAGLGEMSDEMKVQGIPAMWNSYVNVDDIEAVAGCIEEVGGTITVPVMKVVDAGWLAFLQDPAGAHLGLWQKDQHCGAAQVNDVGCFCWNELATRDVARAQEFYSQLLGWEFEENKQSPSTYYMIKNNGRMNGGIIQMTEEWGEHPPCWAVYFTVADTDDTVAKLTGLGGSVNVPPFDTPVGKMAVLSDAQGALFSVIQISQPTE